MKTYSFLPSFLPFFLPFFLPSFLLLPTLPIGKFGIQRSKTDAEGLERTQRVPEVHRKDIFVDSAELQRRLVFGADRAAQLEVFHRRHRHTTSEVEHMPSCLFIPLRSFVLQANDRDDFDRARLYFDLCRMRIFACAFAFADGKGW